MSSWWRAYLIAGVLLALGLAVNCTGKHPLDELRRQQQQLATEGTSATAVVTHMESKGPSVSYEFTLAGQKHYGSADPNLSDYAGMSVGSPIQILYLPSDPDISGYHPERAPKANPSLKVAGTAAVWTGVALLLITGAADFRRRRG